MRIFSTARAMFPKIELKIFWKEAPIDPNLLNISCIKITRFTANKDLIFCRNKLMANFKLFIYMLTSFCTKLKNLSLANEVKATKFCFVISASPSVIKKRMHPPVSTKINSIKYVQRKIFAVRSIFFLTEAVNKVDIGLTESHTSHL